MVIKSPIIAFFALAALVVVILVLTLPAYQGMSQKKSDLKLEEERLEETKEINGKLKDLAEQYEAHRAEAEKIMMALPSKEEIPNLLVSMEAISAENGMLLQSLGFSIQSDNTGRLAAGEEGQIAPPGQQFKKLGLDMSLNGSYSSLKNFLASVEKNLRIIDIESIDFGASEGEGASDIFEYSIQGVTYYR